MTKGDGSQRMTDWGSNHASTSTPGFTKKEQRYDGQFVVSDMGWGQHVESGSHPRT